MKGFDYLSRSYSEPLNFQEMSDFLLAKDDGIPAKAGQKLPNGAIILVEKVVRVFPHRRDSVVLCVIESYQPFVTWVRTIQSDNPERLDGRPNSWFNIKDSCEWGQYYDNIDGALLGFKERVERLKESMGT